MTIRKLTLLLLAAAQVTCAGALLTAPPGSSVTLFANPDFIPANGGVSVISAVVTEPAGTAVPDGTVVQFFTNLGKVDREGKTKDGIARVNLISDSRSGTAIVRGISGGSGGGGGAGSSPPPAGGAGFVIVAIGASVPTRVIVTANPSRITDSRSTHIIATVIDVSGNPVPNVAVIFKVTSDPATEFMDSQGNPIFTDNNGRAEDIMRTRRTSPGTARVDVVVLGAGEVTGFVEIPILLQ